MAINFELGKIEDFERRCFMGDGERRQYNPVTEGLIVASVLVRLGRITKRNVDEWMARLAFAEKLFGALLLENGQPRPFTRKEVEAHIGLSTNMDDESRSKWVKRQLVTFFRQSR